MICEMVSQIPFSSPMPIAWNAFVMPSSFDFLTSAGCGSTSTGSDSCSAGNVGWNTSL